MQPLNPTLKIKWGKLFYPMSIFYPTLYRLHEFNSRHPDLSLGNQFIASFLFRASLLKSTQQNT